MPVLTTAESYGLFTAAAIQDPYPYYHAMRERDPVHWSEIAQAWYFTRYRDVFELQDRPDLSVDRVETIYSYLPSINPERFSDIVDHYNRWLLYRDDAYHDRLKALFIKAMTPRAVERLRPMIQRRVDRAARWACRARHLRCLSRFCRPHPDAGDARSARLAETETKR